MSEKYLKPETVWSAIFGVQVAQVVGANPLDGLRVYGIVLDPEEPAIYFTEEAAERLLLLLEEAMNQAEDLD